MLRFFLNNLRVILRLASIMRSKESILSPSSRYLEESYLPFFLDVFFFLEEDSSSSVSRSESEDEDSEAEESASSEDDDREGERRPDFFFLVFNLAAAGFRGSPSRTVAAAGGGAAGLKLSPECEVDELVRRLRHGRRLSRIFLLAHS